ncbi:unnamed protein product [Arabidopsis thaliana]|uniref:Uncharacterized protein n=1 Tax=Arabidopsis thaliana TaxID=3702 RepID=A0A5S9Y7C0_ARATH|nr:unnamed protein product [Arabidopsis thaliana]
MDTRIGFGSCDSTTKSKKQSSGNSYLNLETGTNLGSLSYTSRLKVIKLASGQILATSYQVKFCLVRGRVSCLMLISLSI